jgi:CRP-like cAMP-binding protein
LRTDVATRARISAAAADERRSESFGGAKGAPAGRTVMADTRRWPALKRSEIERTLLSHKWFSDLSARDIAAIAALAVPRRYQVGELVHGKLDPSAGLYGIISGGVRISSMNSEGQESVFSFFGAGDWFGHVGLIDGLPRTHDIRAVQDSVILCIRHSDFQKHLKANPGLYRHFALKLCELVRSAFSTIDDRSLLSIEARLAKRLIGLADTYGVKHPSGTLINLHLPQRELASIINVARQTVNKRLAEWQKRGWIDKHYGKIIIIRRSAIERIFADD